MPSRNNVEKAWEFASRWPKLIGAASDAVFSAIATPPTLPRRASPPRASHFFKDARQPQGCPARPADIVETRRRSAAVDSRRSGPKQDRTGNKKGAAVSGGS